MKTLCMRNSMQMTRRRPRVLLQYLSAPEYRSSLFSSLANDPRIEFAIACGRESPYPGIVSYWPAERSVVSFELHNTVWSVCGKRVIIQRGVTDVLRQYRPDCLIMLGVDPAIVSNVPLFLEARRRGIATLWWGHGTWGNQGRLGQRLRSLFYHKADGVLVYDERGRQRMIDDGIPPHRVHVVGNCLNGESYSSLQTAPLPADPVRLVLSGRIVARKRVDILIEALAELDARGMNVELDIIGDGPERASLERIASACGIRARLHFHGAVYGDAADAIIRQAHIGVIPSAAGLSVIHYMANGLPVIAGHDRSRHGPEISAVVDGITGRFFEDGSATSLADSVQALLPTLSEMSRNAREKVRTEYSPAAVRERIVTAVLDTAAHNSCIAHDAV